MNAPATPQQIGASVKRKEDYRFLTGAGQYTDDINQPHQTYAVFLRSPHAHAKIKSIDAAAAMKAPGVVAIYTGADLPATVGGLPCGWLITSTDGTPMKEPKHPLLAQGKVRYVGDQVAIVIAESIAQAKDAAELIEVDYEVLPAVVDTATAAKAKTAVHDEAPNNVCYVWALGDKAAVDAAFAGAAHVTKLDFVNNRLIPNAIETRACVASYARSDESYTLYTTSQNPHVERLLMTAFVLGLPEHKVRVIAPDVGGGFGSKIYLYAEETVCVWAAKLVNRPIKWTCDRSEAFLTDAHGRDHVTHAELALDKDGKFLAMRVHTTANMGAYLSTFASCIPTILYATLLAGQYTTPAIYAKSPRCSPTRRRSTRIAAPGRPEATYLLERLVSIAAKEMGIAQGEIRRRNFITTFPVPDAGGADVRQRRLSRGHGQGRATGRRRRVCRAQAGVGGEGQIARASAIRATSKPAASRRPTSPARWARAAGLVRSGRSARASDRQGDGLHRLAQPRPGPRDHVRAGGRRPARHPDGRHRHSARRHRAKVLFGMGTYGSRSLAVGGTAIVKAVDKVIAKGKKIAAHLLEGGRHRHRVQGRQVQRRRHRQKRPVRADRAHRLCAAQLSAGQAGARA